MRWFTPRVGWLLVFAWAVFAVPGVCAGVSPTPHDEGGFFSAEALKAAVMSIKEIEEKHGLPILIETFKTVPEERVKGIDLLDVPAREKLFADWAQARLEQAQIDGVGVLLCRQPPRVQIALGEKTRSTLVTPRDRRSIVVFFVTRFREKRFDDGLVEMLRNFEEFITVNPINLGSAGANVLRDDAGAGADVVDDEPGRPRLRMAAKSIRGDLEGQPVPVLVQPEEDTDFLEIALWLLAIALATIVAIVVLLLWRRIAPGKDGHTEQGTPASLDA